MADYKNALVTGASSGLGYGLALWLARRGIRVHAAGRRTERLEELAGQRKEGDAEIIPLELDVARADETRERIAALDVECGGLDLVVANAGVGRDTHGKRLRWESVAQILEVNVGGAAATLSAALPGMVERGRGHLVGISSLAGLRGMPGAAAYSASKAFLAAFLEGLRVDLQGTGVAVTTIYPGYVKSEMTQKRKAPMPFLLETDDAVERMGKAIIARRAELYFPWLLATGMRTARMLPRPLYDLAAKKLG